jgi:hypothetical protein
MGRRCTMTFCREEALSSNSEMFWKRFFKAFEFLPFLEFYANYLNFLKD